MHTTATTQGKIPAWHEIRSNMPAAITNMPAIDQTMNKETKLFTPIASKVEATCKRTYLGSMQIEEEKNSETIKRQKKYFEGQLVEVSEPEVKKKKGNVRELAFEVQEYEFSKVQEASSDKFKVFLV